MLKYNVPGRIRAVSQCLSSSALQPIAVILVWNKPFSSISFPQPSLKCSPCLHRHVNQRSFSTQANSDSISESPHEHDSGQIIFFSDSWPFLHFFFRFLTFPSSDSFMFMWRFWRSKIGKVKNLSKMKNKNMIWAKAWGKIQRQNLRDRLGQTIQFYMRK